MRVAGACWIGLSRWNHICVFRNANEKTHHASYPVRVSIFASPLALKYVLFAWFSQIYSEFHLVEMWIWSVKNSRSLIMPIIKEQIYGTIWGQFLDSLFTAVDSLFKVYFTIIFANTQSNSNSIILLGQVLKIFHIVHFWKLMIIRVGDFRNIARHVKLLKF